MVTTSRRQPAAASVMTKNRKIIAQRYEIGARVLFRRRRTQTVEEEKHVCRQTRAFFSYLRRAYVLPEPTPHRNKESHNHLGHGGNASRLNVRGAGRCSKTEWEHDKNFT